MGRVDAGLDATEDLAPGSGYVDLGAAIEGVGRDGFVGLGAEMGYRPRDWLTIFGEGRAGYQWGSRAGVAYEALFGIRGEW